MKRYDALLLYCKLPYEEFNGNHPGPTKEFYKYLNKGNKWKEDLFTNDWM